MQNKPRESLVLLSALVVLPLMLVAFIGVFALMVNVSERSVAAQEARATAIEEDRQSSVRAAELTAIANRPVSFSREILPILQTRCVYCHGPDSIAGAPPNGLELDSYENVMLGSFFLPVVVPGEPENSTLILLLRSGGMPAESDPLPPEQIELIAKWIEQGALDN
ncbi:MAG: hypothetical protein D6712_09905 [Chloroflexi bacterium]|nr:MAG: hypothetical protein D6712_09905 [Chloroflexota bacterium]